MDRNSNDRIDVGGHPENTNRELNMQPGSLDDIEQPEAYATRTGQRDVTGELPEDAGSDRVAPGEEIGHGLRARPADGLDDADGRVNRGENIGHGIEARPAEGYAREDGVIERGEDIGNGIRARRADEQDPGNPLA